MKLFFGTGANPILKQPSHYLSFEKRYLQVFVEPVPNSSRCQSVKIFVSRFEIFFSKGIFFESSLLRRFFNGLKRKKKGSISSFEDKKTSGLDPIKKLSYFYSKWSNLIGLKLVKSFLSANHIAKSRSRSMIYWNVSSGLGLYVSALEVCWSLVKPTVGQAEPIRLIRFLIGCSVSK